MTVIEGSTEIIQLGLVGNSRPSTFSWTFNGAPLSDIPGELTLSVDSISFGGGIARSRGGIYSVESSNEAGSASATFRLIVYCKFGPLYTVHWNL